MDEQDLIPGIIADLKRDMKDGFDGVRSDVRQMVTKGEFKAEIGRLDANHTNLKASHDKHVINTNEEFKAYRAATRWTLGFAVTIVGIAVAIINAVWP
jgi:hypothetical protein